MKATVKLLFLVFGVVLTLSSCSKRARSIGPEISGTLASFGASGGVRFNIGEFDEDIRSVLKSSVFYNFELRKLLLSTFYGLDFAFKDIVNPSYPRLGIYPGFVFGEEGGRIIPSTAVLLTFGFESEYDIGFIFYDIGFLIGSGGSLARFLPQFWFSTGLLVKF